MSELMLNSEICLREYLIEDDAKTVAWLNDPKIKQTFGLTYVVNEASHRKWLSAQHDMVIRAIEIDGQHIGNATLRLTPRHHSACLEIYIGESTYRGKGVGFRALRALLNLAFNGLNLNRVCLVTRPDNIAAERLYQKAGFVLEGCERQAVFSDGCFLDQNLWSILRSEWCQS